jgi:hypothetical protein
LVPGKRYAVFAIRTTKRGETIWVRAGVAFVQPDDSMNLTLDVLPIDGQLHIRESAPKQQNHYPQHQNQTAREQTATPAPAPQQSIGGH